MYIIAGVTSYFTPFNIFRSSVGKYRYEYFSRIGYKLVKNINRCGGNATFAKLHEVGVYGNRYSLMPDLNGDEWTGWSKYWTSMLKSNNTSGNKENEGVSK